jgi:hypothetical protein
VTTKGATRLRRIHGGSVLVWAAPGAVVSWLLKDSVAWVTFMSWYAIVVTHIGAWQGARAEQAGNGS